MANVGSLFVVQAAEQAAPPQERSAQAAGCYLTAGGVHRADELKENRIMAQTDAVKPVISGPSQAEGIARFALRATYDDLSAERRERLKVSILDAVACAINAIGAPPIEACRAQAEELGGSDGRCTLIGGGRANPVYAAFYNTALIRYVDFMDSYLARGGLCHPSDNTGAILAGCEQADLSGK